MDCRSAEQHQAAVPTSSTGGDKSTAGPWPEGGPWGCGFQFGPTEGFNGGGARTAPAIRGYSCPEHLRGTVWAGAEASEPSPLQVQPWGGSLLGDFRSHQVSGFCPGCPHAGVPDIRSRSSALGSEAGVSNQSLPGTAQRGGCTQGAVRALMSSGSSLGTMEGVSQLSLSATAQGVGCPCRAMGAIRSRSSTTSRAPS